MCRELRHFACTWHLDEKRCGPKPNQSFGRTYSRSGRPLLTGLLTASRLLGRLVEKDRSEATPSREALVHLSHSKPPESPKPNRTTSAEKKPLYLQGFVFGQRQECRDVAEGGVQFRGVAVTTETAKTATVASLCCIL